MTIDNRDIDGDVTENVTIRCHDGALLDLFINLNDLHVTSDVYSEVDHKVTRDRYMAVRLFKLRDVPDDEADDVRQLLTDHDMPFYETHAGGWGVGTPAIWLHDEKQLDHARVLIDEYQQKRFVRVRAEYEALKEKGRHVTFLGKFTQHPVLVVVFILVALFILYISLSPFLNFGK